MKVKDNVNSKLFAFFNNCIKALKINITLAIFFFVGFVVSILLDLALHALVIFYLIKGIKACADLERLPVETAQVAVEPTPAEEPFSEVENTQAVVSAPENVTETVNEVNGETSVSENGNNDNNG